MLHNPFRKESSMLTRKVMVMTAVLAVVSVLLIAQVATQSQPQGAGQGERVRGGGRGGDRADQATRMEQMRQRRAEQMQEALGVTPEEWKALAPKVEKVQQLGMQVGGGMMMGGRGGRGGRGAPEGAPEAQPTEMQKSRQSLRGVLDNQESSPEQVKTALESFRQARAKAQAELEAAQRDLREVLTVRQEAQLVLMGLLN